jgi:hypothetical protein
MDNHDHNRTSPTNDRDEDNHDHDDCEDEDDNDCDEGDDRNDEDEERNDRNKDDDCEVTVIHDDHEVHNDHVDAGGNGYAFISSISCVSYDTFTVPCSRNISSSPQAIMI